MFYRASTISRFITNSALAIGLLSCGRAIQQSTWDTFQKSPTLTYKVESNSPFVIKWTNSLQLSNGVSTSIDASSFSTIGKFIKYSNESENRSLQVGDCNLLDLRYDQQNEALYLLTSGNIWSDELMNHYVMVFDLNKRCVTERSLLSPELFSKVRSPQPKGA